MVSYPCPFCGAPAGLESGCRGCGRPPYPDAAEVVRLNAQTRELYAEVQAARVRYGAAALRYNTVVSQRNLLAARVKAAVSDALRPPITARPASDAPGSAPTGSGLATDPSAGGSGGTGAAAGSGGVPRGEAAPRTVQNALFVLGGLLLASAAVVFAAVAWAAYGVTGRAVILAAVTGLTLAVPPVALWRKLRATAETFAALGILLVVLDGYAAWYVNLAGLADLASPQTYAGWTFAVAAGAGGGYALATRLRAPRLAAVVAVQPVLPLLALHRGLGATGWTLVLVCVAAVGVLLARTAERVAWVAAGLAALAALPPALHALATVDGVAGAARIAGVVALLAALVVAAGAMHPRTVQPAAGIAAVILAPAAARLVAEVLPGQRYVAFAALTILFAGLALVVPRRVRAGVRAGALVVTGAFAAPYVGFALVAAVRTASAGLPAWPARVAEAGHLFGWQEPVALVLLAVALGLLVRHRAVPWTALVLVAFAAPMAWDAPASIVDGVALLGLLVAALRADRVALAAMPFVAAHLAVAALASPAATLAAYAFLCGLSTVLAVRAAGRGTGLPAAVAGLLALPVAAAAAGRLLGAGTGPVPPALAGATAGLVLVTAAALALGNRAWNAGTIATATAGAGVAVAAAACSGADGGSIWFGTYAAAALAGTWLAARGFRPLPAAAPEGSGRPWASTVEGVRTGHAGAAVVPAVLVVVSLLPAVGEALLRPLAWLGAVWRGAPAGVGLGPDGTELWAGRPPAFGAAASAVTLAVLAGLTWFVAGRAGAPRWSSAAAPAGLAVVLGCVAAGAPWPVVPLVTLAAGLAGGLGAALRRPAPGAVVAAVACWFGIVPGLAGCLADRAATLAGLGAVVAAGVAAGAAGRSAAARAVAWPIAALAGAWLAFAAGRAAELPLRATAYWVLLAAGIALAGGYLLRRRRPEGRALDAVAHGVAVVAFLLAIGDVAAAAGVTGLWGVALGLRALAGGARIPYTVGAVVAEFVAYELALVARGGAVTEAYTVPIALALLVAGWVAARRNPTLRSWTAFGVGLLAGFLPSLALVLVQPGAPGRRLVLGAAAVAVVLAGARLRLRAPIAVGGLVLAVLAGHEVVLFWDYLPRWAPLAVAGALLVGFAVTYERRIRDLNRLRAAMGRMR
ncbi:SCO7613 C-terminal domain-containing membrane protein [Dactylosporangium sp. CA-233914]|uniref:SCO7613 C-terminal domain-containing membrane protein n=1 Tax=Dactylosporangium sp. CA-233914 TaxID=3239934 RepID=UPI003D90F353